jgi:hypothetical protein
MLKSNTIVAATSAQGWAHCLVGLARLALRAVLCSILSLSKTTKLCQPHVAFTLSHGLIRCLVRLGAAVLPVLCIQHSDGAE